MAGDGRATEGQRFLEHAFGFNRESTGSRGEYHQTARRSCATYLVDVSPGQSIENTGMACLKKHLEYQKYRPVTAKLDANICAECACSPSH